MGARQKVKEASRGEKWDGKKKKRRRERRKRKANILSKHKVRI